MVQITIFFFAGLYFSYLNYLAVGNRSLPGNCKTTLHRGGRYGPSGRGGGGLTYSHAAVLRSEAAAAVRSAGLGPMLQSEAAAARLRAAAEVKCGGGGKAGRECDVKKEVIAKKSRNTETPCAGVVMIHPGRFCYMVTEYNKRGPPQTDAFPLGKYIRIYCVQKSI